MMKALQPTSQTPQKGAEDRSARSSRRSTPQSGPSGHLGQLAEVINQSPRVQTQLKLAHDLQGGAQARKQVELSGEINQSASAVQGKGIEKKKPALTKGKEDKKKPALRKGIDEKKKPALKKSDGTTAQRKEAPVANRTGLPDHVKAGVEQLSGMALDDVKVHYNSAKPAQLHALAYAQGSDIHVAPGQEQHLAHEAWHVVQQKQGRVQPTMQMKAGVPVNDDPKLEHEADVMGARAAQRKVETDEDLV